MHVAIINHEFPPTVSGVGSYVYDLAYNLVKREITVTVITGTYNKKDEKIEEKDYFTIYRLHAPSIVPRFLWFQLINQRNIRSILKKENADIFHGQTGSCGFLLDLFKGSKVVTFHGLPELDSTEFLKCPVSYKTPGDFLVHGIGYFVWRYSLIREYSKADKVITFSDFVAHAIGRYYGSEPEICVIPQGVDVQKVSRFRKVECTEDDNLLFAGRLIWRKGIVYLIKAFEKIHKELPDLKLKIIGRGPLKKWVLDYISRKKLQKRVLCSDYVSYSELIKNISRSCFAVLPSLFEGASILMLEVSACEKPTLAFDLPFLKSTFRSMYNAYLVPVSEDALARAILDLYCDKDLRKRLGKNAYDEVLKRHDWSKLVARYIELYNQLAE